MEGWRAVLLPKELKMYYEEESQYLPKEKGILVIESTPQGNGQISAKCRDDSVKDLWSMSSFFGYSTQTFALAVNMLDRFLSLIRIQCKHLSCVSLSCLHMAAKETEETGNITPSDEMIRIGQCQYTASDMDRMEKVVSEKLDFKLKSITALNFLHLYHKITLFQFPARQLNLNLEKLEALLKACLCQISFSRAKPSILALSLLRQQMESQELLEMSYFIQKHLKIEEQEMMLWSGRVAECLCAYASPECIRPNNNLQWIMSRRTTRLLQTPHRIAPVLPTIPEACWD